MKKKGFTLIELLGVIVILALVLAIAVPSINGYLKKSKEKAYDAQLSTIIEAAQAYASTNTSLLQNDDKNIVKITLGQLKSAGFIKDELKNPKNDKYFADEMVIEIIKKGSSYEYRIDKDTIKSREGGHGPRIILNGNPAVYYNLNGSYTELGASAVDYNGNAIINIDINSTNLNMNFEGVYQIKYSVSDENGVISTVYRNVIISRNNYSDGTIIYFNPNTNSICSEAEAVSNIGKSDGCMRWYTFLDDGGSTIKLLLDHNTTDKVAWATTGTNIDGPQDVITTLHNNISAWDTNIKKTARLITAKEVANITGNSIWTANGDDYYLQSNSSTTYTGETSTNKYAWLFNNTFSCTSYGCDIADSNTDGYWTSSRKTNNNLSAWGVYSHGNLTYSEVGSTTFGGVRPVIEISKSLLR